MLRQSGSPDACFAPSVALALIASVAACGIKGPLRPAAENRAADAPPPPPIANPATPPATTSPALPPPSTPTQAVNGFGYVDGELCAEGVPLSALAERYGTPCYVYSRAMLDACVRDVRRRVRRRAASRLLRDEGESIARDPRSVRATRQRLRHRLGRRARARASPPAAIRQRSSSPASARATLEMEAALARGHPVLQRRIGERARPPRRRRRAHGQGRAPISFRVNPDVDPQTHPYISTGLKESKFGVAFGDAHALYRRAAQHAVDRRARHRHAHRLADHRARRRTAKRRAGCCRSSTRSPPTASRSSTSTSAADSAFATATRRRSPSTTTRRMVRELVARPPRAAVVRAGTAPGRRRRRAADARARRQAGRCAQLRDRRRGDERPAAPVAVRRMARRRSGAPAQRPQGALRHRRPDLRERRLPRARSPARARAKAICSPCAARARTGCR